MANEFGHITTELGTTLKRTDWEDVDIHRFDGQATGDMMIASSATQLSRLGIGGSAGMPLTVSAGGIPQWGGDISIGANKLKTTNLFLTEAADTVTLKVRNIGDTLYKNIRVAELITAGINYFPTATGYMRCKNANASYVTLEARITDGAIVEVSRIQGAADPYFAMGGGQEFKFYNSGVATFGAVTLGATLTLNGQSFDAGSDDLEIDTIGFAKGLIIQSTQDGTGGARIHTKHTSASPVANDVIFSFLGSGKDDVAADQDYCSWDMIIEDPTAANPDGKQAWYNWAAGTANLAMTLSSLGALAVDINSGVTYADNNHPVSVFDKYDDALVLRQGIQQRGLDKLVDIGVFSRKGSGSGYMMNVQAFNYLLAGGIYQNRARIDDLVDVLVAEFPQVAEKLAERNLLALPINKN